MVLRVIANVLLWLLCFLVDVLKWAFAISVVGFWFGFWHFVGWDGARALIPLVLRALGQYLSSGFILCLSKVYG